ncbi:MAG: M20 family metallopeptidase [Acidobacteria bacterium]|nr:M20 family metallopeptidase [Acidobacteriota bacterium]
MLEILESARRRQTELTGFIRELVECESPSDHPAGVARFVDLFAARVADIATVKTFKGGAFGPHLLCEFELPGRRKQGRLLGLGHSDTVWPLGTLAAMPFRQANGRLWGPGVLDMKAGLAFFVFAARILRDLDVAVRRKVALLINSDEEVGSDSSRALTERLARASTAVLVLEPGTGLTGKLKTARKGVGGYTVRVEGKASHAGVDFENGASAIVELARQIERIHGFVDLKRGLTVNPGVVRGGTRSNVVAARAEVDVDIRIARLRDEAPLDRRFRALEPVDKRCSIHVSGGLNRPPMERTPAIAALYRTARALGAEMGVTVEESMTGGGSDGNFTAALGVPTLDGLGAVGEGAHAPNESLLVDRMADRTALLAGLMKTL